MLATTLELDANPFISTLKRVDSAVAGFRGRIVTLGSAFTGIQAAASMVANAFGKLTGVLNLGGELTDLSASTGETAGELLILQTAFKNAGQGAEGAGSFVGRLHKAIGGLNEEGASTAASLGALNTSAEELRGLTVTDQVAKLSAGFAGIDDAATRGQVAMNLFGKSGEAMLAVFRDPEAIATARTQVGGLAGTMDRLAPTLDVIGDALGSITLKFQQLTGGALSVVAPQALSLADALNKLDLTNIGIAAGYVALAIIQVGKAVQFVLPVVASLGVGWLASMAATQIASVGIVTAVRAVTVATVVGIRTMMAALGPVGLAVAGLTFLWTKFHKSAEEPVDLKVPSLESSGGRVGGASGGAPIVSNLGRQGLNAFSGGGISSDPLVSRADSQLAQLREITRILLLGKTPTGPTVTRKDLPV